MRFSKKRTVLTTGCIIAIIATAILVANISRNSSHAVAMKMIQPFDSMVLVINNVPCDLISHMNREVGVHVSMSDYQSIKPYYFRVKIDSYGISRSHTPILKRTDCENTRTVSSAEGTLCRIAGSVPKLAIFSQVDSGEITLEPMAKYAAVHLFVSPKSLFDTMSFDINRILLQEKCADETFGVIR